MKKTVLLLVIILISFSESKLASGQNPLFDWVHPLNSTQNYTVKSFTTDAVGNSYLVGSFSDTLDFYFAGANTHLICSGVNDAFVAKFNEYGLLVWAYKFGGVNQDGASTVVTDKFQNVYIGGFFSDTVDFDPGFNIYNLQANNYSMFLLKLDSNGSFKWVKSFAGNGINDMESVVIDDSLNIYATGLFSTNTDFDPNNGVNILTPINYSNRAFLLKLDSNASLQWVRRFGGFQKKLHINKNNQIIIAGVFNDITYLSPLPSVILSYNPGLTDVFITKLNSQGYHIWSKTFGANYPDYLGDVTIDSNSSIYTIGSFQGSIDFDTDSFATHVVSTPQTSRECFIHKLDSNGDFLWVKVLKSTSSGGNSIEIDNNENVLISGMGSHGAMFCNVTDTLILHTNTNYRNGFISKMTKQGKFEWVRKIGGNLGGSIDFIDLDSFDNIYSAGTFVDSCDFDPNITDYVLVNPSGANDPFVHKLKLCQIPLSAQSIAACNSYLSPSGKFLWTAGGIYSDTLVTPLGCDSIIQIKLDVTSLDTTISQNGLTLTSNDSNCLYQWVRCDSGYAPIVGQNNQSYNVIRNGIYAVILTLNNCSDTSDCIVINNLSATSITKSRIEIYPNPSNGKFVVTFPHQHKKVRIKIHDVLGRTLLFDEFDNPKDIILDLSNNRSGVYFLECFSEDIVLGRSKIQIK